MNTKTFNIATFVALSLLVVFALPQAAFAQPNTPADHAHSRANQHPEHGDPYLRHRCDRLGRYARCNWDLHR